MIRVSLRLTILSRFFVLPCCITGSALFCSDKRTSGAATKSAKIDKKASQEPKNAGRNRIHVIGHVFEYPTMYYSGNPRHIQTMIAYKILTECFWKFHAQLK